MITLKTPKPIGLLFVAITFSTMYLCQSGGLNKGSEKFHEIQRLSATLPVYPGMTQIDSSSNSTGRAASVAAKFRSDATYEEVRQFYINQLREQSWIFQREKILSNWGRNQGGMELTWNKGEYQMSIEYSGKPGYEWNYAIGIYWYQK